MLYANIDRQYSCLLQSPMPRSFEQNWTDTFRYAAERSPFYRELFREIGSVPPLEQLPLIDKSVLSKRNLDFLCVPREQVAEIVTTSGTTGNTLLWMLTEADVRRLALNERLSFETLQMPPQSRKRRTFVDLR